MYGTVISRMSMIDELYKKWNKSYYGFSDVGLYRLRKIRQELLQVPLAGWHYSYIMSTEEIQRKIKSFSHCNEIDSDIHHIKEYKEKLIPINPVGKMSKLSKYEVNKENTHNYILDNYLKFKKMELILE